MKIIPKDKIKKILIIRPDMIGDVVLITPAISAIKKNYPDAEITVLTRAYSRAVLDKHPFVKNIIEDKITSGKIKNPIDFINYAREIKAYDFDSAINYLNLPIFALLLLFAKIPFRVGDKSRIAHGWIYNFGIYLHWRDYTRHEVQQNLELIKPLGILSEDEPIILSVTKEAELSMQKRLESMGVSSEDILVGIPAGTGGNNKAYLPEDYAKAMDIISRSKKVKYIITGGPKEIEPAAQICALTKQPTINMANKTSFQEFLALIKRLNLYIGADTGPFHIAAGFKVPIVALFTARMQKPTKWGPWQTRHLILRHPEACKIIKDRCHPLYCKLNICQKSISSEEVAQAALTLLDGGGFSNHKDAFIEWVKKSLNILIVGKNSKRISELLISNGYRAYYFEKLPRLRDLISFYRENDINIVHQSSKDGTLKLMISYLLSSIFLEIPILWVKHFNIEASTAKDIVNEYLKSFKRSIL